jgi:hypothetical protein
MASDLEIEYYFKLSIDRNFHTCLSANLLPDDPCTDPATASAAKTNAIATDSSFILIQ